MLLVFNYCFLIVGAIRLDLLQRTRIDRTELTRSSNYLGQIRVAKYQPDTPSWLISYELI